MVAELLEGERLRELVIADDDQLRAVDVKGRGGRSSMACAKLCSKPIGAGTG
jgi:hypothetical protein